MLGQDCAGAQQDLVHLILAPTLVDVGGYPVVEFHDHPELPENMEAVQPVVSIVYVPASGPGKGEPIVVQHDVTKRERGERLLQKGTISHTTLLQRVHAAVSPAGAPLPEGAAYVLLSAEHLPLTSQYAFFPMRLLWSVAVQPRHLGKSAAEAMGAPPGVFQWVTDRFTVTKRQGKYKAYELSHRAPAVRMPALPTAMSVMWPVRWRVRCTVCR
ncbi:unnamed protein product [Symbiodinium sp. KB8]|nr:unnamed protein product [Symbiodinium sp. KB8]